MKFPAFSKNKFLVFSAVSVFFFATAGIAQIEKPPLYVTKTNAYEVSRLPILTNTSSVPVLSAQGVYAYDIDSGVVLYEKNPDMPLFPASTTKIVTALVALDHYNLEDVINTGVFKSTGSTMGLTWHEEIKVKDLLYGLLVYSGNDAAEVLANNYPGGRDEFIKAMNQKAIDLHAKNTYFENPSGLDQTGQMTTAKDLTRIASQAMLVPDFAQIVGTKEYIAQDTTGKLIHRLENRNELLGEVPGVLGVKTGWTEGARENLVTYVERDGKRVVVAILGSQDRFGETKELVEWIFGNYSWEDINYSSAVTSP